MLIFNDLGPLLLPLKVSFSDIFTILIIKETLRKPGTHQTSCFERAARSWYTLLPHLTKQCSYDCHISDCDPAPLLYCIPLYSALSLSLYNTPGGWCLYTYLWPGITTCTHTTKNLPHIPCRKWFNKQARKEKGKTR